MEDHRDDVTRHDAAKKAAENNGITDTSNDSGPSGPQTYQDLGNEAERAVNRAAGGLRTQGHAVVDYLRGNGVQDVMDDVTGYMKSHPSQALIGAAVLGFFAGRMARRS